MKMPDYYPENHPDAVWLWPWPKDETREFFEDIGAIPAFAPGPEDTAYIKFILFCGYDLDDEKGREMLRALAMEGCGMPAIPKAQLERITAKPIQPDGRYRSYIEIPIAQVPRSVAKEFRADFDRLETLLPQAKREAGRLYAVDESPDGFVLKPDLDNEPEA